MYTLVIKKSYCIFFTNTCFDKNFAYVQGNLKTLFYFEYKDKNKAIRILCYYYYSFRVFHISVS